MSAPKFADSHNMVVFLAKPTESDEFEQILVFLNANPIKYALTVNPTIYTSCIEQFWATAKVKNVNGEVQLQALGDGKKVIITDTSVRRDLQLEDAEGIECLPNDNIFEQLALMGFVQVFLDKQVGDMSTHDEIFVTPSHTKKGMKIDDIDKDAEVTLVDETKGRYNDAQIFDTNVFNGEEVFVVEQSEKVVKEVVSTAEVSAAVTITTEEITLAQALAELRSAKPKLQAEEEEQARLAREKAKKVKEANISWDNVQAMIEADRLLAERLQAREQEELTDEENARLFVELLKKRKKHFVALRAQEKRNKPPTKAQKKSSETRTEGSETRAEGSETRVEGKFEKEDLENLWGLVKAKHGYKMPEEAYKRVLWGDLKVMFEPHVEDAVWKNIQGHRVKLWRLYDSCGVHFVRFDNMHVYMLVENKYYLRPPTITDMLIKKLQADHWIEMCYQLLKLITKELKNP
ncbi:hypothetical protein Tco_0153379 [Tanacetum coccineum]